ncbi:MAG: histidine kinase [Rhodoferax sp.]|uniref:sensor histidine kinase n=1 Tax=Rhodoferax sp. TaxID=50421 RepID=UPI001B51B568|nr:histidine kinase [Rhodoferax sp.]MBP9904672.1 histidine kinase [Rhodoferax sp.]
MLNRLINWHRSWEDEILAVLADPSLAPKAPPGYRRRTAEKLAKMSVIERRQLREFSVAYRGRKGYLALAKWLLLFCLVGAAVHLLVPAKFSLRESLVLSNLLGLSLGFGLFSVWFNYRRLPPPGLRPFLVATGLASLGALTGASTVALVDGKPIFASLEKIGSIVLFAGFGVGLVFTLIHSVVAGWRNREYELLTRQLELQAQQDRMARQLSEASLHLLQAQIEPHFLFNTLGAVQQLAQVECPAAASLTAHLITFLRASLSDMRTDKVTLASEFSLIEAYLQVMKTRLADRLVFTLELPAHLAEVSIPSMLLLTLVENSIKHGIEPALRGGTIEVRAQRLDSDIGIQVRDSGVGLATTPGVGVGLTNVQERLRLTYGGAASFTLEPQEPQGSIAAIRLPDTLPGVAP